MSGDSTVYTIGTALNRARDQAVPVELLVNDRWMSGTVVAVDGFGVVLRSGDAEHVVARMEAVAAVKVGTRAPGSASAAPVHPLPQARPMPSARASAT